MRAIVPQSELHLYASALQSMTHGRARLRREFRGYEEMPGEAAQRVIQETAHENAGSCSTLTGVGVRPRRGPTPWRPGSDPNGV